MFSKDKRWGHKTPQVEGYGKGQDSVAEGQIARGEEEGGSQVLLQHLSDSL